jgi:hypothetical protein
MLDGTDKETFYALRLLRDVVDQNKKPIIIWSGAGVSKWRAYPTWLETAEDFHSEYVKFEPEYNKTVGSQYLHSQELPRLFDLFRDLAPTMYHKKLASLFGTRPSTPVYSHFVSIINCIKPIHIVTTNVDESLEQTLPTAVTVQKSDLERCLDLLNENKSFIAKLHGSVSSVESIVFTAKDYEGLVANPNYVKVLESLFLRGTVVFIGYSLRDKYVLDMFQANLKARPLFGDGPHFVVKATGISDLPASINTIRYIPEPHTDHRSAIMVLDIIRSVKKGGHVWFSAEHEVPSKDFKPSSAYFISDITPPGASTSAQTLTLAGADHVAIVGQGFVESELLDKESPALHDLTVGLISFDTVYAPLSCVAKLHDLLGSEVFWMLVQANVFRFVYFQNEPAAIFPTFDAVKGGDVGMVGHSDRTGKPLSLDEQIRRQLKPAAGHERDAEALFAVLRSHVSVFDDKTFNIPSLTRGALLHPSVQRLLGISDAVLPTSIPRWVIFPVLRLANTIMAGCTCEKFVLPATKIGFGSEVLVGSAFAVAAARDWADSVSSYVLTGRFNTELGAYIASNSSVFPSILVFRDTQAGIDLRREIMDELATNAGTEFVASVNAGLRRIVPTSVMDKARDQLSSLLFRHGGGYHVVPAVWTNTRNSDLVTRLWRARSRQTLEEHCLKFKIGEYDLCPCGSGDKLRFCCRHALREQ